MRKWFLIFVLAVFARPALSQVPDQYISTGGSSYVDIVRGAAWGSSSFNRVFLFTPLSPDQRFCLFVANNNPTNPHTFSLAVYQTGDRQVRDYSNNTGRFIQDTVQGTPSPVAAASMSSAYVHANAGARIALVFSASSSAGGSPDTADIFLVQTTAESCGPVASGTSQVSGSKGLSFFQDSGGLLGAAPLQPAALKNSENTSSANTALAVTIAAVANQRVYLAALATRASGGSCSLTVKDGVGGTVIWTSDTGFVGTSTRTVTWTVPLASTLGNGMEIDVSACGAGNTSTLDVQGSQL